MNEHVIAWLSHWYSIAKQRGDEARMNAIQRRMIGEVFAGQRERKMKTEE